MCARYTLAEPGPILDRWPSAGKHGRPQWPPRFNVAPTQDVPALRGDRELVTLRWGLVPAWASDPTGAQKRINARVETVAQTPLYRSAFERRRCAILADGFYEWSGARGHRQPHRITIDDGAPFAFAGLWERWRRGDQSLETCTIVTCPANERIAPLHDRMPAIIADDDALDAWLHGEAADALAVAAPFDSARLRVVAVGPAVNRATFEDPSCIEPATPSPALRLFD
ncbi:MAG TPA: SOS response-associated peptidase [Candidatus Sulfotelmatobacter sp.]|nr:SOS response-associated peptidase [Candidatus Sulfotelmatobacter sp.]